MLSRFMPTRSSFSGCIWSIEGFEFVAPGYSASPLVPGKRGGRQVQTGFSGGFKGKAAPVNPEPPSCCMLRVVVLVG